MDGMECARKNDLGDIRTIWFISRGGNVKYFCTTVLAAVLAVNSIAARGNASEWKRLDQGRTGSKYYYDYDSIRYLDDNLISVWTKQDTSEVPDSRHRLIMALQECDCLARRSKLLCVIKFSKEDGGTETRKIDEGWQHVGFGDAGYYDLLTICSDARKMKNMTRLAK